MLDLGKNQPRQRSRKEEMEGNPEGMRRQNVNIWSEKGNPGRYGEGEIEWSHVRSEKSACPLKTSKRKQEMKNETEEQEETCVMLAERKKCDWWKIDWKDQRREKSRGALIIDETNVWLTDSIWPFVVSKSPRLSDSEQHLSKYRWRFQLGHWWAGL